MACHAMTCLWRHEPAQQSASHADLTCMVPAASLGGMAGAFYATNVGATRPMGMEGWRFAFLLVSKLFVAPCCCRAACGLLVATDKLHPVLLAPWRPHGPLLPMTCPCHAALPSTFCCLDLYQLACTISLTCPMLLRWRSSRWSPPHWCTDMQWTPATCTTTRLCMAAAWAGWPAQAAAWVPAVLAAKAAWQGCRQQQMWRASGPGHVLQRR